MADGATNLRVLCLYIYLKFDNKHNIYSLLKKLNIYSLSYEPFFAQHHQVEKQE